MEVIAQCASNGSEICLIHHSSAEKLVNKLKGTMDRLPDYLDMIRQHGMVPGLSAHMPELILYSDENGYDVQTYIQIYNCAGFLMQIEIEGVRAIIENAKKPVMTMSHLWLRMSASVPEGEVFCPDGRLVWRVPAKEGSLAYTRSLRRCRPSVVRGKADSLYAGAGASDDRDLLHAEVHAHAVLREDQQVLFVPE